VRSKNWTITVSVFLSTLQQNALLLERFCLLLHCYTLVITAQLWSTMTAIFSCTLGVPCQKFGAVHPAQFLSPSMVLAFFEIFDSKMGVVPSRLWLLLATPAQWRIVHGVPRRIFCMVRPTRWVNNLAFNCYHDLWPRFEDYCQIFKMSDLFLINADLFSFSPSEEG